MRYVIKQDDNYLATLKLDGDDDCGLAYQCTSYRECAHRFDGRRGAEEVLHALNYDLGPEFSRFRIVRLHS